jgi:hypothetical protein
VAGRYAAPVRDDLGRPRRRRPVRAQRLRLDQSLFRRATASGAGRIRTGGIERDVIFAEAAPDSHGDIDQTYHAKYDRYGPAIVGSVTGTEAAPVTIRLLPR